MARLQISDPTGSEKGWSVAQGYPGWQVLPGNAPLPAKHINWVNCWSAGFLSWLWLNCVRHGTLSWSSSLLLWTSSRGAHAKGKFAKEDQSVIISSISYYMVQQFKPTRGLKKECSRPFVSWCMQTMNRKKLTLLSACINHSCQEFELKVEVLLSPLQRFTQGGSPNTSRWQLYITISCVQFAFFRFILNLMVDWFKYVASYSEHYFYPFGALLEKQSYFSVPFFEVLHINQEPILQEASHPDCKWSC